MWETEIALRVGRRRDVIPECNKIEEGEWNEEERTGVRDQRVGGKWYLYHSSCRGDPGLEVIDGQAS